MCFPLEGRKRPFLIFCWLLGAAARKLGREIGQNSGAQGRFWAYQALHWCEESLRSGRVGIAGVDTGMRWRGGGLGVRVGGLCFWEEKEINIATEFTGRDSRNSLTPKSTGRHFFFFLFFRVVPWLEELDWGTLPIPDNCEKSSGDMDAFAALLWLIDLASVCCFLAACNTR